MNTPLKIVHCTSFSDFKKGEVFYSNDRKLTHGLIQNGHMVYQFSFRDLAKTQRKFGLKKIGIDKMNHDLIQTCLNIEPDILLLGKAETVTLKTLEKIKKNHPNIKIAQWFVDHLERENDIFFDRFRYIDYFFQSSDFNFATLHAQYKNTTFSYLPYTTDELFEKKLMLEKEYDVIYIARDHKEDIRYKFALELKQFCDKENINLKMYGSLSNPLIFGQAFYNAIGKAKIAINFNRTDFLDKVNPNVYLASSDRMNHFLGTGTCTFSPHVQGFDTLYKDNYDLIYYDNIQDCFQKILALLKNGDYAKIGNQGQQTAKKLANAKRVTQYMIELIMQEPFSDDYEWKDFILGEKILVK